MLRVSHPLRTIALLTTAFLLTAGCSSAATTGAAPGGAGAAPSGAAPTPSFADLTRGDAQTVAKLFSYDATNRAAVVEPVNFLDHAETCAAEGLDPAGSDCNTEWTTDDSRSKVTVPVAADPEFRTWEGEDGAVCLGEDVEKGGTCPMTAKAFAQWASANEGELVAVTTVDGEITKIAMFYTP